ncbi:MAG: family 43 glycosylhydrolase, partial [Chloroflexota bacterium]|nr:family 43 glycosylhydrolase [Chloroflexota bacterium]
MRTRSSIKVFGLLIVALACVLGIALFQTGGAQAGPAGPRDHVPAGAYDNPARILITGTGTLTGTYVESWADPMVISATDGYYYAYATTDPLADSDRDAGGSLNFHKVPQARSTDLVHWTYIGDAFTANPAYAAPGAGLWAPDVRYFDGMYHMYYAVTDVNDATSGEPNCPYDRAIGVATSATPYGPWTHSSQPVVYPRRGGPGCNFYETIDPAFLEISPTLRYIYFGSYYGGIWARQLLTNSIETVQAGETQVAIPNRYEGAFVYPHGGFYYLFASATDCCR